MKRDDEAALVFFFFKFRYQVNGVGFRADITTKVGKEHSVQVPHFTVLRELAAFFASGSSRVIKAPTS